MLKTDIRRASEALRTAAGNGGLRNALTPAVFGCPFGHTARLVTAPLPLGRCRHCGARLAVLGTPERSGKAA